jgi:hypothetical protein
LFPATECGTIILRLPFDAILPACIAGTCYVLCVRFVFISRCSTCYVVLSAVLNYGSAVFVRSLLRSAPACTTCSFGAVHSRVPECLPPAAHAGRANYTTACLPRLLFVPACSCYHLSAFASVADERR